MHALMMLVVESGLSPSLIPNQDWMQKEVEREKSATKNLDDAKLKCKLYEAASPVICMHNKLPCVSPLISQSERVPETACKLSRIWGGGETVPD